MSEIREILDDILKRVPGVEGIILIDIDGIPIEMVGHFDMNQEELGALLAACFNSYSQVGEELGQKIEIIIVEFGNLKLCQTGMPRGMLTIIASKESYLGMIRLEAKRAIETLTRIMDSTQDLRKTMMSENKFRWPDDQTLEEILDRLKKEFR